MASAMIGTLSVDAHAVLAPGGTTGAEHGAELGDAPTLLETAGMTSADHAVEPVGALDILELTGGIASALAPLDPSAWVEPRKNVAAFASKS